MKFYLANRKIYADEDHLVWIALGRYDLICIGNEQEVKKATPERIVEMVYEALAYHKFALLNSGAEIKH